MARKVIAVVLAMLMLMMSMAVYATETEHVHEGCCCGEIEPAAIVPEDEAVPYAERCSNCGTGTLRYLGTTTGKSQVSLGCGHVASITAKDIFYVTRYYYRYNCSNNCTGRESLIEYGTPTYQFVSCSLGYTSAP